MKATCSEDEFIRLFEEIGPALMAKRLEVADRTIYARRFQIEQRRNIKLVPPEKNLRASPQLYAGLYEKRSPYKIDNGVIIVGSDAHYWPGEISTAHRALVHLTKELKPKCVILNGDCFDGARISKHAPSNYASPPTVQEQLEATHDRLDEIYAANKSSDFIWTLGNHDIRFESRLAQTSPEYAGVSGFCLKDQMPGWKIVHSVWVNSDIVVKHRFKDGIHATHTGTVMAGKTMVTGHLHSLKVTPFNDYNGLDSNMDSVAKTRYGIDTGTLSNPYGQQMEYGDDNPVNHRSGFVVLTFHNGELLWPEVARVVNQQSVDFRGTIIKV